MYRPDETWHRLREWTYGQAPSERLAAQILLDQGFTDFDPSHPLGGPDGGKDALCRKDGQPWLMAVYFPRGKQSLKAIQTKLLGDLAGVDKNQVVGMVFVTNQELSLYERASLGALCQPTSLEIFHLERIATILDQPRMAQVRQQFLYINPPSVVSALGKAYRAAEADSAASLPSDSERIDQARQAKEHRLMPYDAQFDVFLSHSAKDKSVVRTIAERLKQAGLRVWFDEWEIGIGDSIFSKIEEGLEQSRILLFCMSANAFGSDWAILESQTVRFRDPLNKKRLFVPLRLDDAEIKGTLAQLKYLDWRKPDEASWRSLLRIFPGTEQLSSKSEVEKTKHSTITSLQGIDLTAKRRHAKSLLRQGRFDQALDAYSEVCNSNPSDVIAKTGRAEVLKAMGRFDQALEAYSEVCNSHPDDVVAKCGRAEVLRAMGRNVEALDAYTDVCNAHPDDVVAKSGREQVLSSLRAYDQALRAYSGGNKENPENIVGIDPLVFDKYPAHINQSPSPNGSISDAHRKNVGMKNDREKQPHSVADAIKKTVSTTPNVTKVQPSSSAISNLTVFISYAWEDDDFRQRVKVMRDWLQTQGFMVVSDFDHDIRAPKLGWPIWMLHSIENATVVLVVCSPKYKARFEKRASSDSGKSVAWEGAVITQDIYDAAQRNDKFYPVFLDPANSDHVPKLLTQWNNGHSFPSKKEKIVGLIHECFADTVQPSIADANISQPLPTSLTDQVGAQPIPVPSDNAFERIQQTRQALLANLNQSNFPAALDLPFDEDGMPQALSDIFKAVTPGSTRATISEQCITAIRDLAKHLLEKLCKLPASAGMIDADTKTSMRAALINSMQQAILLSAREDKMQTARIQAAYNTCAAQAVDVQGWLSVSVLMRDKLAPHLRVEFSPGKLAEFSDQHHVNLFDGPEMGTREKTSKQTKDLPALVNNDRQGAETEVCKIIWNALFPGEAPYSCEKFDLFQGELRELKDNENHLLVILKPEHGMLSPDFLNWMNQDMHLGVVTITTKQGLFEISEGTWRAKLATLYKTLQPLDSANKVPA